MELNALQNQFGDALLQAEISRGQGVLECQPAKIREILQYCRQAPEYQMDLLLDVVAVDFPDREPRFDLVYLLYSTKLKHRMRLKIRLNESTKVPSASDIWKSADWAEREVFDMFGLRFENHPNLKRILLFEGFEGHPLRKDYPVDRRQPIPEMQEKP